MAVIAPVSDLDVNNIQRTFKIVLPAGADISEPIRLVGVGKLAIKVKGQTADQIVAKVALVETPVTADYSQLNDSSGNNPFASATANNMYLQSAGPLTWLTVERSGDVNDDIEVQVSLANASGR